MGRDGIGQQLPLPDETPATRALGDEHVATGQECHRPRHEQPVGHRDDPVVVQGRAQDRRLREPARGAWASTTPSNAETNCARWYVICARISFPDARFDSRFPIPDSRLPTPDSRFPFPVSRFPFPAYPPIELP